MQKLLLTFKITKISHNFTLDKKKKKLNLFELTQVFCGLLFLLSAKIQANIKLIDATLTVVSLLVSSHNAVTQYFGKYLNMC